MHQARAGSRRAIGENYAYFRAGLSYTVALFPLALNAHHSDADPELWGLPCEDAASRGGKLVLSITALFGE